MTKYRVPYIKLSTIKASLLAYAMEINEHPDFDKDRYYRGMFVGVNKAVSMLMEAPQRYIEESEYPSWLEEEKSE